MCMHLLEERGSDRTPKCPNDQYASLNLKFYEIKKLDRLFDSKTTNFDTTKMLPDI